MVFSSFLFIFGFLPIALLGFWLFSRISHHASKLWLCVASIVFYGWWELRWVPVLLCSVAFNYLIGHAIIARSHRGQTSGGLLALGITANLAALLYYKYLLALLLFFDAGGLFAAPATLPLGISFFTFTQIAFLIDANQSFEDRYTPTNYLRFVTFFPHLIAGPIVHHRDLMPQFEEEKTYHFSPRDMSIGLAIFSIGLAKKTLIADNISTVSLRALTNPTDTTSFWIGALAYSMQLYFDFSGYSDMAIGLARMFGIKFPVNFDSPYKATSIIDFWQRWHITLTRFLTAYVYNPVALALVRRRARKGLATSKRASQSVRGFLELIALPTWITMTLAGIWHGAGLQFIIYGALHGFYISVNHAWRTFGPKYVAEPGRVASTARAIGYGLLVYLCVLVAQIMFRASSVGAAMTVLEGMVGLHAASSGGSSVMLADFISVAACLAIAWFAPNTQQLMAVYDPVLDLGRDNSGSRIKVSFTLGWAVAISLVLFLGLFNIQDGQPFIYFQF
jgi:alginate O-acetyltransferase complex protein AlgI